MSAPADTKATMLNMDDDFLREVEKTVIIPKMMREHAHKVACRDAVQAFEDCARGKTVSIVWYCREVKDKMYECLRANLMDSDFEREKAIFLEKRREHRRQLLLQEVDQAQK